MGQFDLKIMLNVRNIIIATYQEHCENKLDYPKLTFTLKRRS